MSRIGVVTAPVKCEENLRTPIEIKQEHCDQEDAYADSHTKHLADSVVGKPPSSSPTAAETEDNYEFLGNLKYEVDESTDATTTELLASKNRGIICHLCQQVYCNKPRYGYHRKRDFIAHLVKAHDYSHLRGHRRLAHCKGCKTKKERWAFAVGEGVSAE